MKRTWITLSFLGLLGTSVIFSMWSVWSWISSWGNIFAGVPLTSPMGCDCGVSVTFWQHPALYSIGLILTVLLIGITSWVGFFLFKSWNNTRKVISRLVQLQPSAQHQELFDSLCQQVFHQYWPQLFYPQLVVIQEDTPRAMSTGFIRPRVFVSVATLEQVPSEELSAMLLHELMHVRSFDPVLLWLSSALSSLLPTVWRLSVQTALQEYVECKTDEEAAELVGSPVLGRALLRVASWPHLPLQATAHMRSSVETRLQVLAGWIPRPEIPWKSILGASSTVGVLVCTALLALSQVDQVYAQELNSPACMEAESIVYVDHTLVLICPAPLMSVE